MYSCQCKFIAINISQLEIIGIVCCDSYVCSQWHRNKICDNYECIDNQLNIFSLDLDYCRRHILKEIHLKFNDSKILHLKFQSRASWLEKHTSPFLFCWIHSFCFNHLNIFFFLYFQLKHISCFEFQQKKNLEFILKRVNSGNDNDDDDVWFIANWTLFSC